MAGTTIVNPSSTGSSAGTDQIDQAFSRIYNMFGPISGGGQGTGGVSIFGLQLARTMGTTAPGFIQAGGNLLGTGMGVTKTGLDVMQDPTKFYQQLLSGDPRTMTAALAPTAANLATITAGATDQASRGLPGGGYRDVLRPELQFAQLGQLGTAAEALQAGAAKDLATIGATEAGIGLDVGRLGEGLTGQGLQALQNTIADTLSKMGINIQGGTSNTFLSWAQALNQLV